MVANIPSLRENLTYRKKNGGTGDKPLLCNTFELYELTHVPDLVIKDVQFSILNPNYVLTLTSDSHFYVSNLTGDIRLDFAE